MKSKALTQQIDTWAADHRAALATLTSAEQNYLHAVASTALTRARAEQRVRTETTAKQTEGAIAMAVALDAEVLASEQARLMAESALIAAKNAVEASRATKAALAWHVALVTMPSESAA